MSENGIQVDGVGACDGWDILIATWMLAPAYVGVKGCGRGLHVTVIGV